MLSTTSFILLVLLPIGAAVALFVVWPLLRRVQSDSQPAGGDAAALNRDIIRERRARLDAELAELPADSPEREALIQEFSAAALADLKPASAPTAGDAPSPADAALAGKTAARKPRLVLAVLFLTALVALPIAFYRTTGMPEATNPDFLARSGQPDVDSLLATLEARLKEDPSLVEGWLMLGRSRLSMGQREAAIAALEKALEVDSEEPQLAAQIRIDLADALGQQAGNKLDGRPWALIQDALAKQPRHAKAMALAGAYQLSQGNHQLTLGYWEPLLAQLEPGSGPYRQIARQIEQVRAQAGLPPLAEASIPGSTAASPSSTAATGDRPAEAVDRPAGPVLKGAIQLDASLATQAGPEDTVFLAVRGVDESGRPAGPPLAVRRIRVADLPYRFSFSDADAMGPMGRLSSQQQVIVIARISKSGQPTAQPGDLEGSSPVVRHDADDVQVDIDTRL
ncbi:MAG: c-type cytochrome biogenesis protein CcmI [Lautropia sp.]|nr:c-type cytochrome biogenesis protein CcmI [Lautropia sp.]